MIIHKGRRVALPWPVLARMILALRIPPGMPLHVQVSTHPHLLHPPMSASHAPPPSETRCLLSQGCCSSSIPGIRLHPSPPLLPCSYTWQWHSRFVVLRGGFIAILFAALLVCRDLRCAVDIEGSKMQSCISQVGFR
jgi:hypothetical protein